MLTSSNARVLRRLFRTVETFSSVEVVWAYVDEPTASGADAEDVVGLVSLSVVESDSNPFLAADECG